MKRESGFTYITVLFVVAMMSGGLALIGEVWHTANVREKEAELLHIGNEYRKAIERYYLSGPSLQYPKNLSDLIKDPRQPGTVRHLRRLYPDPITGKDDWGLVKSADGGFAGVFSLSAEPPLKTSGFAVRDASFEGKTKYSDWQFVFAPAQGTAAKPGAKPEAKPGATPNVPTVPTTPNMPGTPTVPATPSLPGGAAPRG
ncbi:MAG TPA: type II secretion system protein [Burkholderiales bacterium]|nr:type II secretion system protein [Burkholderiales bacterium]